MTVESSALRQLSILAVRVVLHVDHCKVLVLVLALASPTEQHRQGILALALARYLLLRSNDKRLASPDCHLLNLAYGAADVNYAVRARPSVLSGELVHKRQGGPREAVVSS